MTKTHINKRKGPKNGRKRVPRYHFPAKADRNYNVLINAHLDVQYERPTVGLESGWDTSLMSVSKVGKLVVSETVRRPKKANLTVPTARSLRHDRYVAGHGGRYTWLNTGWDLYRLRGVESQNVYATIINDFVNPLVGDSSDDEAMRAEAILEAMSAVKDQRWNAGVMLAESKGVAEMAEGVLQLIADTRRALLKKEFKKAYTTFRKQTKYMSYPEWKRKYWAQVRRDKAFDKAGTIPGTWLYYHFGLKPTIDDITDAADDFALRKTDLAFGQGGVVHGYAKKTTKRTSYGYQNAHEQAYSGDFEMTALHSVRVVIRVQPKASFLNKLSSLGVTNPPEAAWNAVPFSWFVDYFTSFGEWLGALDTGLGWEFAETWTESWRTTAKVTFSPRSGNSVFYEWPSQNSVYNLKVLNRIVKKDLYGPMGTVLPHFERKGPSVQRIANALAVAASLFKGSRGPSR